MMQKVNRIIVELTQSPNGKPCIGMKVGERRWLLLTVKLVPLVDSLRKQLADQFQTESLPGLPLDWRSSLASNELVFWDVPGAMGLYVQEDRFDHLVALFDSNSL